MSITFLSEFSFSDTFDSSTTDFQFSLSKGFILLISLPTAHICPRNFHIPHIPSFDPTRIGTEARDKTSFARSFVISITLLLPSESFSLLSDITLLSGSATF